MFPLFECAVAGQPARSEQRSVSHEREIHGDRAQFQEGVRLHRLQRHRESYGDNMGV
jgi:hypothetical protein